MKQGEIDIIRPEQDWLVIMGWMAKVDILNALKRFSWYQPGWIRVNRLCSDSWKKHVADFCMPNEKGEFMAYLHEVSLQGYSIRIVAPDGFTGLYLDKRGDMTTNIDLELMETIGSIDTHWKRRVEPDGV